MENEAGYILENLNPTSEGYYYAWDQEKNQIIYLTDDLQTVYYPEDYTLSEGNCWVTVGTAEEAAVVAGYGYNLALECVIDETIELSNVVSINTLGFTCKVVTFNGDTASKSVTTAYMIGNFGEITDTLGASSIVTTGNATTLSVSSNNVASSVTVGESKVEYQEAVYGLFGTVKNATIKRLNVTVILTCRWIHLTTMLETL